MDIFEKEYTSVADTFLLPLTGLPKDTEILPKAYMFWRDYSIEGYQLILVYEYENLELLRKFLVEEVFPVLDRKGYILENYDIRGRCILVLDIAEWALDIELCLDGKYSKLSKEAKTKIELFHNKNKGSGAPLLPTSVYAALYPNKAVSAWSSRTALEVVAEEYGLDLEELQKSGELGIKYDRMAETLLTEVEDLTKA